MFFIRRFVNSFSSSLLLIIFTVVCIAFLMGCSGDVGSPEFHFSGAGFNIRNPNFTAEKFVETEFPVESFSSINFQVINGEVGVTGHRDVDAIVMTAHLIVGSDSQADADSHIDDLEIQVTESAEEILIQTVQPQKTNGRKYDVKYDVMVPSGLAVMVTQVNGTIEIIDIENSVDVSNTNGDVLLSDIVGGVAADIVNGSITANVTLPVHESIDLIIDNGSIELHIPSFTSAVFGASVGIGAINTSSLAFDDVVQTDQSLTGTLGNGEGVIELWAGDGNINVVGYD